VKRRTALKIVTLGALAPNFEGTVAVEGRPSNAIAWPTADYTLRFFTTEENELLDQFMEMIIPADAHSPGAHAARVSLFADLMVATSGEAVQKQWRQGLKLMQAEAASSSLSEALAKSAAHEGHPSTDLDHFFEVLKRMTVNGYYTSSVGIHQDLEYQGNTYLNAFPGCMIKKALTSDE
jgi:Gluconate 2-dehydrogenase subunit 3